MVIAVLILLLINSLPLLVVIAVWLRFRRDLGQLSQWRRSLFQAGAAANASGSAQTTLSKLPRTE